MFFSYTLIRNIVTRHLLPPTPSNAKLSRSPLQNPPCSAKSFLPSYCSIFSSLAIYLSVCLSVHHSPLYTLTNTNQSHDPRHRRGSLSFTPSTHSLARSPALAHSYWVFYNYSRWLLPSWHRELAEPRACFPQKWKKRNIGIHIGTQISGVYEK